MNSASQCFHINEVMSKCFPKPMFHIYEEPDMIEREVSVSVRQRERQTDRQTDRQTV